MADIRITPASSVMSFTSSLNYIEKLTQEASGSLNLYGSGSTGRTELLSVDGNNGRLFTVSDDLSDSLFSVNTIAGLPVIEAFANNTVVMGQYGKNVLVVTGSRVGFGIATPEEQIHISTGSILFTSRSANDINVRLSPGGGTSNIDHYLDVFTGGSRRVRMGNSGFDVNGTGLFVDGRIGLTAEALGSAATQILVTSADPASTQRLIQTRTPAQLRSDIGAGVGTVTSIATNNGVTGGTITSTGTIGLATAYGDTVNPYASKTANTFLAAPNGSSGVPSFRAIAAADVPTLNQNTTGTATNATNVAVTDTTTGTGPYYLMFADGTTGNRATRVDSSALTFNASTNTLTVANLAGTATNATNVNITTQDTTPVTYNLTFVGGTSGNNALGVDSTTLTYNPSTSTFTTPIVNSTTAVRGGNGSAGAPALSFSGDTDTGIYNAAANMVGVAGGGIGIAFISQSGFHMQGAGSKTLELTAGTAGDTTLIFGPSSTGGTGGNIDVRHASLPLIFRLNTTEQARFTTAGNMGLGTTTPSAVSNYRAITLDSLSGTFTEYRQNGTGLFRVGADNSRPFLFGATNATMEFYTNSTSRMQLTGGGALGLGVTPANTAGRFEASNDIVAYSSSDKRWKNNIKNIDSPLEKISQISGVEFDWIEDEPIHGNKGHDIGVIAQEIEHILPEAVQTRESGMKAVKYEKIIPLLIEVVKEQQKQIEELKQIVNGITK